MSEGDAEISIMTCQGKFEEIGARLRRQIESRWAPEVNEGRLPSLAGPNEVLQVVTSPIIWAAVAAIVGREIAAGFLGSIGEGLAERLSGLFRRSKVPSSQIPTKNQEENFIFTLGHVRILGGVVILGVHYPEAQGRNIGIEFGAAPFEEINEKNLVVAAAILEKIAPAIQEVLRSHTGVKFTSKLKNPDMSLKIVVGIDGSAWITLVGRRPDGSDMHHKVSYDAFIDEVRIYHR